MVILVGRDAKECENLQKELKKDGINFKIRGAEEISLLKNDIFVFLDTDFLDEISDQLNSATEEGTYIFALATDKEKAGEERILYLPKEIDPFWISKMIKWFVKRKKKNVCLQLLRSFFEGGTVQIIFLDNKQHIISCIPTNREFLGHKLKEQKGKKFEEVFGLPIEDIPDTTSEGNHIRYLTDAHNKEVSCTISKMPYEHINIPGLPQKTKWVLFINEIREIKDLEEKSERLNVIQDNILKERTIELESANEILQKQALELKNALEELEKKNRQIVEELSLASELQKSLLPKEFPTDLPLNFAHKYIPYAYIGGDFFDIKRLDKSKVGIIIADVSGHGVSSAFITTMFKSQFDLCAPQSLSTAETLSKLNKEFTHMIHTEHYITAFYSIIDTNEMKLYYSNAGHPNQLLFHPDGRVTELSTMGFFLGMFEGTEYEEKSIELEPGDRIVYNTDGILETENENHEQFGKRGIIRVMKENLNNDIDAVSNNLLSELMMYMAEPNFQDDITILITEVIASL